jgi:hypothetical protein
MPAARAPRVALLLVGLAVIAGAALAAGPAVLDAGASAEMVAPDNSSSYLQPLSNETTRRAYIHADVDVGVAVDADLSAIRARHERLVLEQQAGDADNRTKSLRALRSALAMLENRTAAIERGQQSARDAFREGTISSGELARTLAILDARASALDRVRETAETIATSLNPRPESTVTNFQNLEAALETIGGPATRRLGDRYGGNRTAGATYVSVDGSTGLVVATVAGDDLVREARDDRERQLGGPDTFGQTDEPEISVALQRAAELYNWSFEHGSAAQPLRGYGNTTVYRITVEHVRGMLSAYLDGTTGNVFYEVQEQRAGAVPVTARVIETGDGLELTANTTYPTGPMRLTVVRETTGSPVDANVTVDETPLGRTGEDGTLWAVTPIDGRTVTARTGVNTTVSATVG